MALQVIKKDKRLVGEIHLATSKSISNRLLIIKALNNDIKISNLSNSEDTKIISKALDGENRVIDAGHAGTAMRFLTAYFALKKGDWIITGSERMLNRPIGHLVKGLEQLGAEILYLEKGGFPPLKISGKPLTGKKVTIDGSISSQYITAILLISPALPDGLEMELTGKIASTPYITLTLEIMKYFGIQYSWEGNLIKIKKGWYENGEYTVEADWSGASYWYEMAAFAEEVDLKIHGLLKDSLQGDSIVTKIYEAFGVQANFTETGIHLRKISKISSFFDFDFSNYPDLVQTVTVTCVLKHIPFKIAGAESLKIKETDRIKALQTELRKFGAEIIETSPGTIEWDGRLKPVENKNIEIETYVDHRMAMAFAPAALINGPLFIKEPNVVVKSYPNFWEDLKKTGFEISG